MVGQRFIPIELERNLQAKASASAHLERLFLPSPTSEPPPSSKTEGVVPPASPSTQSLIQREQKILMNMNLVSLQGHHQNQALDITLEEIRVNILQQDISMKYFYQLWNK